MLENTAEYIGRYLKAEYVGKYLKHNMQENIYSRIGLKVQGGFFKWASPEFAKCCPVSNWLKKNGRVPDWPPLMKKKV